VQEAVLLKSYVDGKSPLNSVEAVRQHLTNLGIRLPKEPFDTELNFYFVARGKDDSRLK
jgi:hypothetical protein